jgi:hypothetical protein
MKSPLERLREIRAEEVHRNSDGLPYIDTELFLAKYPPDELSEPCPDCGSKEKWIWLDGRRLCRPCVIQGGSPPGRCDGIGPLQEFCVN